MTLARTRLAAAITLAITVLAGATPARATTADDKRAEAKRIATERERLIADAERLNEQSLASQTQLDQLTKSLAGTNRELVAQTEALAGLSSQVQAFAVKTYVFGIGAADVTALVDRTAAQDVVLRRGYAPAVLGAQTDIADQYRAAQADIASTHRTIGNQRDQQSRLTDSIAKQRTAIADKQTRLTALAKQVDGQLSTLVAEEQARQQAAADEAVAATQREAARRLAQRQATKAASLVAASQAPVKATAVRVPPPGTPGSTPAKTPAGPGAPPASPGPATRPPPAITYPAASPAAAIAVAEALRQLGKPYVFATNGPDTFDCSGLTQWAWAKAGVAMEHYTVSQYDAFPKVPLDQLQPGDLVFFNVNLGHMGMYIGGGQIVQSPRTGDVVKISTLAGRNVVGAVRPG